VRHDASAGLSEIQDVLRCGAHIPGDDNRVVKEETSSRSFTEYSRHPGIVVARTGHIPKQDNI